ncbi:MAG: GPN-loop GTPase 2-like protein [Olpidium bornovanus]|uniref:GPN-loop GTPase 2 n=1 Tax=Olpidium bornovanus TaxID=278681 RepID=A0A8H7ZMD6_9FUNG|nr:MAG: GPN-loop GTPase 2-like protein [Olpidium bornovanus]
MPYAQVRAGGFSRHAASAQWPRPMALLPAFLGLGWLSRNDRNACWVKLGTAWTGGSEGRPESAGSARSTLVNLDPANEFLPYECAVNMSDLVTLTDVVAQQGLGPNGGIMYVFSMFAGAKRVSDGVFKGPLAPVNLVDAHYCTEPSKFISVLLISLVMMLQLELPHINVLSKVDLMEAYGKLRTFFFWRSTVYDQLDFNLDFYTEVLDLSYLLNHLEQERFSQNLVHAPRARTLLNGLRKTKNKDKDSVVRLVRAVDKAGGYVFGVLNAGGNAIILEQVAREISRVREVMDVQERWETLFPTWCIASSPDLL